MSDADNNRRANKMRTIRTKVYKFDELNEDAKKKVLTKMWDINVSEEWWEFIYSDAAEVGIEITGFDIGRGNDITGKLKGTATETIDKIMANHGEVCATYKTAQSYLTQWNELVRAHSDGINTDRVCEEKEYEFDQKADQLEQDFLKDILEDYLSMLRSEYEYYTSEEAVIETIEANEYEFTRDGNRF